MSEPLICKEHRAPVNVRCPYCRIDEAERLLAAVCKALKGLPGPDGSDVVSLAEATMRDNELWEQRAERYKAALEKIAFRTAACRADWCYASWACAALEDER